MKDLIKLEYKKLWNGVSIGSSLSCMSWSILVSILLSGILLVATIGWEKVKRKRGLY